MARTAAGSLNALFDPDVGTTRSWSWGSWANGSNFTTIVDNSMVNELLFEAGTWTGGQAVWIDNATTHAQTMLSHHVRPDDSTYHVVVFDENTGAVKYKATHQGYSVNSTWSRGQAWTMFGLALAAKQSGNADLLQGARDVSDWWIAQTTDRAVPPWDFDFLAVQDTAPRDTTAAAIAAVGLFRLSDQVPGAHYADEAARRPRIEAGMTDGGVALELVCEIVEATGGWQLVLEQRDPVTGQWSDMAGAVPGVTPSHQTGLKRLAWVLPEGPSGTWFRLRAEQ